MYRFNYHRPGTIDEAVKLRQENEDAAFLSGGHTLLPTMKQRLAAPSDIIDLSDIEELSGIESSADNIRIAARSTHAQVAASEDIKKAIPALAKLAAGIGDPQVRNRGTIGGSLANSDPAADYPAAVLGLNATVITNRREISADDYFLGMFETALEDDEIITAVRFPVPKRAGYVKFPNPASRYAIVGVMAADTGDGIRVAVTGAGPCAFRVEEMEKALSGNFSPDAIDGISVPADDLNSDIHASADYRSHLVTVMAKRAIAEAGN